MLMGSHRVAVKVDVHDEQLGLSTCESYSGLLRLPRAEILEFKINYRSYPIIKLNYYGVLGNLYNSSHL